MEKYMELVNGQTEGEDITEKNYATENSNVPGNIEENMLHLETALRQMKNNKSPGYVEVTSDMIKAAGPIGTQWLYRAL
jgi:hypothetical protein